MLKCIYNECRWPDCKRTCGLVPESKDYTPDSSAEENLIYHLQNRISELRVELQKYHAAMEDAMEEAFATIGHIKRALTTPTYHDDYPRTCDDCDKGEYYDDEDK